MIAWPILRNSQVTAREAEASAVFTSLPYCWSFQPQKHGSPIWSLTQPLLGADKPTISHLKEEILSYLWYKNLNFSDRRVQIKPNTNNPLSAWVWNAPGSANIPLHFCLSLSHSLGHIKEPYLIWKRTQIPFIWPQNPSYQVLNEAIRAPVLFKIRHASYCRHPVNPKRLSWRRCTDAT